MTTHAELVAAVEKARPNDYTLRGFLPGPLMKDAHLDTLAAILNLHTLWMTQQAHYPDTADGRVGSAAVRLCAAEILTTVADALRKMGAL